MRTKPQNPLPKTLPGAVCAQMVRCGKANCKCALGELHGPYFYHFVRVNGALVKRYIKAQDVAGMRAACTARRAVDRQRRLAHRVNVRELIKTIEQLRANEKLLLEYLEVKHGQAEKGD
ncbi:MAG: DUF6788 family protein [Pyrinomonadaceae bacterium]